MSETETYLDNERSVAPRAHRMVQNDLPDILNHALNVDIAELAQLSDARIREIAHDCVDAMPQEMVDALLDQGRLIADITTALIEFRNAALSSDRLTGAMFHNLSLRLFQILHLHGIQALAHDSRSGVDQKAWSERRVETPAAMQLARMAYLAAEFVFFLISTFTTAMGVNNMVGNALEGKEMELGLRMALRQGLAAIGGLTLGGTIWYIKEKVMQLTLDRGRAGEHIIFSLLAYPKNLLQYTFVGEHRFDFSRVRGGGHLVWVVLAAMAAQIVQGPVRVAAEYYDIKSNAEGIMAKAIGVPEKQAQLNTAKKAIQAVLDEQLQPEIARGEELVAGLRADGERMWSDECSGRYGTVAKCGPIAASLGTLLNGNQDDWEKVQGTPYEPILRADSSFHDSTSLADEANEELLMSEATIDEKMDAIQEKLDSLDAGGYISPGLAVEENQELINKALELIEEVAGILDERNANIEERVRVHQEVVERIYRKAGIDPRQLETVDVPDVELDVQVPALEKVAYRTIDELVVTESERTKTPEGTLRTLYFLLGFFASYLPPVLFAPLLRRGTARDREEAELKGAELDAYVQQVAGLITRLLNSGLMILFMASGGARAEVQVADVERALHAFIEDEGFVQVDGFLRKLFRNHISDHREGDTRFETPAAREHNRRVAGHQTLAEDLTALDRFMTQLLPGWRIIKDSVTNEGEGRLVSNYVGDNAAAANHRHFEGINRAEDEVQDHIVVWETDYAELMRRHYQYRGGPINRDRANRNLGWPLQKMRERMEAYERAGHLAHPNVPRFRTILTRVRELEQLYVDMYGEISEPDPSPWT